MRVERCALEGVLRLTPTRHGDARGWFAETYRASLLAAHGVGHGWVQHNQSFSQATGTIRGLHFQAPPHAQAKLVQVLRGAVWDVVVDLRRASQSYGRWEAFRLEASDPGVLYVPAGFAHGFCTLVADTEVFYAVSAEYAPHSEGGLRWNDPALALPWPLPESGPQLSPRDALWPGLDVFDSPF
jgi:dTDP-4-dehydrorhamnose 3,5-epimerase